MPEAKDDFYQDREQARIKHALLKDYLPNRVYKVSHKWRNIIIVDGFAGPNEVRSPGLDDSSFGSAVAALRPALEKVRSMRSRFFFPLRFQLGFVLVVVLLGTGLSQGASAANDSWGRLVADGLRTGQSWTVNSVFAVTELNNPDFEELLALKEARKKAGTVMAGPLHACRVEQGEAGQGAANDPVTSPGEVELLPRVGMLMPPQEEDWITVRVRATDSEALLRLMDYQGMACRVHGRVHEMNGIGFFEADVPVAQLKAMEALREAGLLSIRPVIEPVTRKGTVTSQADFAMQAERLRVLEPGFDGTGVKIGVLSDTFDARGGAAGDIASGDLPADGVEVLQDLASGSDEGRAMLQLIHDLAPGADLAYATAFTGQTGFANNIQALADAGATVIVDDIGYLDEPAYQDGIVSQAVDAVAAQDVVYLSSAGNSGTEGFELVDAGLAIDPVYSNDFIDLNPGSGSDTRQSVTLQPGQQLRLALQWNQPFFTANGITSDLDLFVINPTTNGVLASSTFDNPLFQEAFETIQLTNNFSVPRTVEIVITRFSGPIPTRIKYINYGSNPLVYEYDRDGSTINGHPGAKGALGIAAIPYFDQLNPEPFTSAGPVTILFSPAGQPLAEPEIRAKPDLAGIDGTDTTFFGSDAEGNGFPNFFGTSAAAPHVAAVAALVRGADPNLNREQVIAALTASANPDAGAPGFDDLTGAGLVNAVRAVLGINEAEDPPLEENFDLAAVPADWKAVQGGSARISFTGEPGGSNELNLGRSVFGIEAYNQVDIEITRPAGASLTLSFSQRERSDSDQAMSETFTGQQNSDGVAVSADEGSTWTRLVSLTGSNSSNSQRLFSFNLDDALAGSGAPVTTPDALLVRFQAFEPGSASGQGHVFDDISVIAQIDPGPASLSTPANVTAQSGEPFLITTLTTSGGEPTTLFDLTLTVNNGTLTPADWGGGLGSFPASISGAETAELILTGSTTEIDGVLTNGINYTSNLNFVGTDTLQGELRVSTSQQEDPPAPQPVVTGNTTITVTGTPFQVWLNQFFPPVELADATLEQSTWGLLANSDLDGFPNIVEYGFGLSPINGLVPENSLPQTEASPGGTVRITARVRKNDPDLEITPVLSTTLDDGSFGAVSAGTLREISRTSAGSEFDDVVYEFVPGTGFERAFVQFEVSYSAP